MTSASAILVATAIVAFAVPALAGPRRAYDDSAPGYVTAESRFGGGTVSGPVRIGRYGREVQLPGGTWEPCKRSCSETLRVSTVDFWYAHGPNAVAPECGIFGCLTLRYPR
jgi:hypothetical protein